MSKVINHSVVGMGTKSSGKTDAIIDFLKNGSFIKIGTRLGMSNFNKAIAKFNDEKNNVFAHSFPSVADIQTALFLYQKDLNNGKIIPVLDCENKENPVVRCVKKSDEIVKQYFSKNRENTKQFNPVPLILGLLGNEKYKYSNADIETIEQALKMLKN